MKTAIYIEQGVTQLVLTPDNEWEKSVLKTHLEGNQKASIRSGQFYECQRGYFREGSPGDQSLIIRLDQPSLPEA